METSVYPTATFTLTEPIDLGTLPDANADVTATATGELTLHGVTKHRHVRRPGPLHGIAG